MSKKTLRTADCASSPVHLLDLGCPPGLDASQQSKQSQVDCAGRGADLQCKLGEKEDPTFCPTQWQRESERCYMSEEISGHSDPSKGNPCAHSPSNANSIEILQDDTF